MEGDDQGELSLLNSFVLTISDCNFNSRFKFTLFCIKECIWFSIIIIWYCSIINVNPSILTQCIGVDNYEGLVDAVNKVDYLCRNGLVSDLKYAPDSAKCDEYREQVKRVADIYAAIDEYSAKSDSNTSNLEKKQDKK